MKYGIAVLSILAMLALAPAVWANMEITVPCEINHDNLPPPFSSLQGEHRSCSVVLPSIYPYGVIEVTIAPITQIAPGGHPGWLSGCFYATPSRVNAPAGLAVTTAVHGTGIRAMVINLRTTESEAGLLTIGVHCE